MRFDHPFTTYIGREGDPKFNGSEDEFKEYILREDIIQKFLVGEVGEDVLLDVLNEQGIDPSEYIDSVEHNINFVIKNQILVVDQELWLPQFLS